MTAPTTPRPGGQGDLPVLESRNHRARVVKNAVATGLISASFVLVLVPLVAIFVYVFVKGIGVIDWQFLTTSPIQNQPSQPNTVQDSFTGRTLEFGMAPAIVGTVLVVGLATAVAVPLGVLGGIYLNEYGKRGHLAGAIRFLTDVMTGVPSVVMGLFVFTALVLQTGSRNAFFGALALAFLMLPVVIRSTEEMLRLVPVDQREASLALGGRQAGTIMRIVMPAAAPGVLSGALLAIARAAGETAPLLFVVGLTFTTNWNPFVGENTALPPQIYDNAAQPFAAAVDRAWGAALVLIVIAFVGTIASRLIAARFANVGRE